MRWSTRNCDGRHMCGLTWLWARLGQWYQAVVIQGFLANCVFSPAFDQLVVSFTPRQAAFLCREFQGVFAVEFGLVN